MPLPDAALVLGLDLGGTATRAALFTLAGERVGAGRALGGNPTSHGVAAAAQFAAALRAALAGHDPRRVRAGVLGMAGAARLTSDPAVRAAFDQAWSAAGLRCPWQVCSDAVVAYAAGTAAPDGTVLIAGTGAIAVGLRAMTPTRIADGHGWLLGDTGSGFWLGREVVRHTLAGLDAGEPGPLGRRVMRELIGTTEVAADPRRSVEAVIQAVTQAPPVALARLAPLVCAAATAGDTGARALLAEAAAALVATVARIRDERETTPLVLAGGLLTGDTPLAALVRAAVATRWPGAPVPAPGDGAAGAAWLALRGLPQVQAPELLHRRFVRGADDALPPAA